MLKYQIKEVRPNIFAVIVKDKYDRAMLFCRVQEYYECPNPKFRGKQFSVWDYMKWYHKKYGRGFSYGADWSGFNIPIWVAKECYNNLNKIETPYDKVMDEIVQKLNSFYTGYMIGAGNTTGETFKHEVCHALYHTNKDYKKQMDNLTKGLPKKYYDTFKKNLLGMGYTTKVINDEIQAYLQYGYDDDRFGKGVSLKQLKQYNKIYLEAAKKILSNPLDEITKIAQKNNLY
jgi:hypothetical protein